MHHLVIGEGQIGRALIERARADGDTVTVLRRSAAAPEPGVTRVRGDALDPAILATALVGADAVHCCFHAPYDSRVWARDLPPREAAVLDAAAERDLPVVFPESMYGFQGDAADLVEGSSPSPRDAKGDVRVLLLAQRRAHAARTLSLIASDLIGPSAVGTGASVPCAMILERVAAGRRPIVVGDPAAAHTLTFIPDLAEAMLCAARHAERLAPAGDRVLHAPSGPAPTQAELIDAAAELSGRPARRPVVVPRAALRALSPLSALARELHGIAGLWYGPCVLRPGVLTADEGLAPTTWRESTRITWQQLSPGRGARPTAEAQA